MQNDKRVPPEWQPFVDKIVDELSRNPVDQLEVRLNDFRVASLDRMAAANPDKDEMQCAIAVGQLAEAIKDRVLARVTVLN